MADPRVTKTAMMADLHLPLKPRSDLALLNGIAHILIRDDLIDRDYIDDAHHRLRRTARVIARSYTPERVAEITGLERRADLQDRVALRPRQGRLHRLDDGREPQHARARRR